MDLQLLCMKKVFIKSSLILTTSSQRLYLNANSEQRFTTHRFPTKVSVDSGLQAKKKITALSDHLLQVLETRCLQLQKMKVSTSKGALHLRWLTTTITSVNLQGNGL